MSELPPERRPDELSVRDKAAEASPDMPGGSRTLFLCAPLAYSILHHRKVAVPLRRSITSHHSNRLGLSQSITMAGLVGLVSQPHFTSARFYFTTRKGHTRTTHFRFITRLVLDNKIIKSTIALWTISNRVTKAVSSSI